MAEMTIQELLAFLEQLEDGVMVSVEIMDTGKEEA